MYHGAASAQQALLKAVWGPLRSSPVPSVTRALNRFTCLFPPPHNTDTSSKRQVLVLYTHPLCKSGGSYTSSLLDAVTETLQERGHEVRIADLYAEHKAGRFHAVLGAHELADYMTAFGEGHMQADAARHVEQLLWCESLVLVYPTWWYAPPALLKGWLDRVLVPGATFDMPNGRSPVNPYTGVTSRLTNIRHLGVVSTYGNAWEHVRYVGDPGRKLLSRGLRPLCHPDCSVLYLALHSVETCSQARRAEFLRTVRKEFSSF